MTYIAQFLSNIRLLAHNDGHTVGVLIGACGHTWASEFKKFEAADARLVPGCIGTSPGVESEVVMIAVPGDEAGLVVEIGHQIEAEGLLVKCEALIQFADIEVHMAKNSTGRKTVE